MAEPARKIDFDPRDETGWNPRVIAGGGEGGGGERPNLHVINGGDNPVETPAQEEARQGKHLSLVPPLANAEKTAAADGAKTPGGDLGSQEQNAAERYGNLYRQRRQQSKDTRAKGGPRGIFIGLGAGGGLLSVVAGFSFMLPLKLPAIMDNVIDAAGRRVEHVVEKRAERIVLRYILQGSKAALANDTGIATGNPIGDLFANIRTSRFEEQLKAGKYGLSFEPGPNKTVKLVQSGREIGAAKTPDDILKILAKGDAGESLSKADLRRIVRSEMSIFRVFKRAKFVKWLRLKYNIPRVGAREQKPGESDEDYKKAAIKDAVDSSNKVSTENMAETVGCVASAGEDCSPESKKNAAATDFEDKAGKALADTEQQVIEDTAKKGVKEVAAKGSGVIAKRVVAVLLTAVGVGAAIPYVGEIDAAARLVHGLGQTLDNDLLQKLHADAVGKASAVLATGVAGMADGTKLGIPPALAVGAVASQFDGAEASLAYNVTNYGEARGDDISPMEKVNENTPRPAFYAAAITVFDTVGWVLRGPLEAWYYTVSQLFDLAGKPLGDFTAWIIKNIPGIDAITNSIVPYLSGLFEGLMKMIGMYIDPLAIGTAFYSYVLQGFLVMFNGHAKDLGMMKLTAAQRTVVDGEIRQEHIADLKDTPLTDRLFNLSNSDSLASALVAGVPSTGINNPIGTLASMSIGLVGRAPSNLASITSTKAFAAGIAPEDVFGIDAYGALDTQLDTDVDPGVFAPNQTCPANDPNKFNKCSVDKDVVDSMNCVFVHCADVDGTTPGASTDISVSSSTQELATKILALSPSKIQFDTADNGPDGAKQDLIRASNGVQTHCGATHVTLDPALLNLIYNLAQKYTFLITAMVSDHTDRDGCTAGFHPKGKAVDLDLVDGNNAITSQTRDFYRQFAIEASKLMTGGGRIGQSSCLGTLPLQNGVTQFDDRCTHIHLDVP